MAAKTAEGRNERQFYRTLTVSLMIEGLLIPASDDIPAGYIRTTESLVTDTIKCRIMRDLARLPSEQRSIALNQIIRTFFEEAGI